MTMTFLECCETVRDKGLHKSTRLEDMVYQDLRRDDPGLDALESSGREKLSTFPALSRDIYQSFYSLNVRKNEADTLSETAKRFNSPILEEMMRGEDYPAIKAACEGRQLPAYEAAGEFITQVAENLDSLLEKAGGGKKALDTLERLEDKRDKSMEQLRQLLEKLERSGPDSQLEKQVLNAANRAQSQVNQAEAVGRMMQNNALKNKDGIAALIAQAGKAAAQRAESAASALMAWGDGPDSGDPKKMEADRELIKRVCRNKVLMETARYLGRLKELIQGKRKSGYAYGRGEKYSVELGGDINRALG